MENDLISVIVPVYNVEKYLENCVDSIIKQTYKNIEIILVDDGSNDNSGKICDDYAKKDNRIKVIHYKNQGAAAARNLGINNSTGTYISFIDSDDEVSQDYIEYLYSLIKKYKTKLSISSYIIKGKKRTIDIGKKYKEEKIDTKECLERLLLSAGFTVSSCAKMYDKNLFENIKFPEGQIYEDDATIYKIIMQCNVIAYGNESKYMYYRRENSVMTKSFTKKNLILLEHSKRMYSDIYFEYPELKELLDCKSIIYKFSILRQMVNSKLDKEMILLKNNIIMDLRNNKKLILKSTKMGLREKIAIISLLFGEKFFKWNWNLYNKIKY